MFHHVLRPMVAPAYTSAGWDTIPAAKATAQVVQNSPEIVPEAFLVPERLTDSSMNRAAKKDNIMVIEEKDNKHTPFLYISGKLF